MSQASDLGVVRAWGAPSMPDWLRRCYSGGSNAQSPAAMLSRTSWRWDGRVAYGVGMRGSFVCAGARSSGVPPVRPVGWRGEEAGFSFRDAGYAPLADFDGSLK
jgi:hypothetical protein